MYILILVPETGNSGGKRKNTVVTMVYVMPSYERLACGSLTTTLQGIAVLTRFANHPNHPGNVKGLSRNILRPRRQLIATGIA